MAATWITTVRKILTTTRLLGGDDTAPLNGPIKDLEDRTDYLLQKTLIPVRLVVTASTTISLATITAVNAGVLPGRIHLSIFVGGAANIDIDFADDALALGQLITFYKSGTANQLVRIRNATRGFFDYYADNLTTSGDWVELFKGPTGQHATFYCHPAEGFIWVGRPHTYRTDLNCFCRGTFAGAAIASGSFFTPTIAASRYTWTITGTDIEVPHPGTFEAHAVLGLTASPTTNPTTAVCTWTDGTTTAAGRGTRYSATAADPVNLVALGQFVITNPATQRIKLRSDLSNLSVATSHFTIKRVG